MKQKIFTSVLAAAAISLSAPAMASTITNLDLAGASPFSGFDWSSNGTAISAPVSGTLAVGDTFTTYYFADAVSILKQGGGSFVTPGLISSAPGNGGFAAGAYEYTIVAQIEETVTSVFNLGGGKTLATFSATGNGSWDIYYDNAGLGNSIANQIAGTGFTDGVRILGGTVNPGDIGNFTVDAGGTGGNGQFDFNGLVNYTNTAYITPEQLSTVAFGTLQFGNRITDWTAATGTPWGSLPGNPLQFQADGNQNFAPRQVPEPGVLALLGLGMFGLFATTRRKNNQAA
ncbi:flocculation-associated PEP-CTERM protein PepA [Nitrosomonas sp.]|uniref:flocculation-associated PEP-CTERM protein PepA n=1 Tax=Nitrosomonas sp. TaxID=42353 RepID=UPI0025CBAC9E|nr:flocculation-associated PEP-CTERM protein PepA [Nitrosomonas sp.]MCC6917085.1 flocculation-associated PEP-CTERM protein PepA [Nitrosomonas sp.]